MLRIDDAIDCLVLELKKALVTGYDRRESNDCDAWIPKIASDYSKAIGEPTRQGIYRASPATLAAFYDAAWYLARIGVLRPGTYCPEGATSVGFTGDGFTLTDAGRSWITSYDRAASFPIDPGRFNAIISQYRPRFGSGFDQRISEAAACYRHGNYLACCAMSGAACESVLLAIASTKSGDEAATLKTYQGREGRREITKRLTQGQKGGIISNLESATKLLHYWRDDASHGVASSISEPEAHDALSRLLRFAQFAADNWTELTERRNSPAG